MNMRMWKIRFGMGEFRWKV